MRKKIRTIKFLLLVIMIIGGGFGYYRDLPDWYDPRLSIWHFLLRRRFRHWNEYADRCAGNQYRI